jgi:hypothetical protein
MEDQNIENFNEEELIIYNYLNEEDKEEKTRTVSDLKDKILELEKMKDLIPKIEEKDQKMADDLIKQYFEEKEKDKEKKSKNDESKDKKNIIYTIDNLLNEKEIIEKRINDKKEAIEILKEINNLIKDNNYDQNIMQKINSNSFLSRNQELKTYLYQINKNMEEKEDLTEEQKIICSFRNLIKSSLEEAKNKTTEEITILSLFSDLNFENIDIQKIINENEGNSDGDNSCKDEKISEFQNIINANPSFVIFIKELHKYYPYDSKNIKDKKNSYIFYKVINLLISRYEYYYSTLDTKDNKNNRNSLILLHNNLELFTYVVNYYILFYNNSNNDDINIDKINKSLINIVIKIKNISTSMFSQVMADFNDVLIQQMEGIETFENIRDTKKFDMSFNIVKESVEMIFNFFDKLRNIAIHREIIFYFNTVLSIYFNSLNQKVLKVTCYDLDDIKGLLNISQEILKYMNKYFEKISSQNMDLSIKFMNILEQNVDYLKFQEILFILNSNLKQINNYLMNANYSIYITRDQLIRLLDSTFNASEALNEIKKLINEKIKAKAK